MCATWHICPNLNTSIVVKDRSNIKILTKNKFYHCFFTIILGILGLLIKTLRYFKSTSTFSAVFDTGLFCYTKNFIEHLKFRRNNRVGTTNVKILVYHALHDKITKPQCQNTFRTKTNKITENIWHLNKNNISRLIQRSKFEYYDTDNAKSAFV